MKFVHVLRCCLLTLALLPASLQAENPLAADKDEVRVLFVGHSFFSGSGGMHNIVQELLEDGGYDAHCELVPGGLRTSARNGQQKDDLDEKKLAHFERNRSRFEKALAKPKPWDYIVVIGWAYTTTWPGDFLFENTKAFVEQVRERSPDTRIVFYQNHAPYGKLSQQPEFSALYEQLANEHDALLASCGDAWKLALTEQPDLMLHTSAKDSHPGFNGLYLSACTLYATITDKTPEGLRTKMKGTYRKNGRGESFQVEEQTARYLQNVAARAVFGGDAPAAPKESLLATPSSDDPEKRIVCRFDADGEETFRTAYDRKGAELYTVQIVRKQGDSGERIVEEQRMDTAGAPISKDITVFGADGKKKRYGIGWDNDAFIESFTYEYHSRGRLVKHYRFAANGDPVDISEYVYGADGRLKEIRHVDLSGKADGTTVFEYDKHKRLICEKDFSADRKLLQKKQYSYDDNDRVKKVETFDIRPGDGSEPVLLETTEMIYE